MKIINKLVKGLFYVTVALYALFQSCLVGLLFSGSVVALVLAVWSIIKPLPNLIIDRMWLVYLVSAIPLSLLVLIHILKDLRKPKESKKNKEQNNSK